MCSHNNSIYLACPERGLARLAVTLTPGAGGEYVVTHLAAALARGPAALPGHGEGCLDAAEVADGPRGCREVGGDRGEQRPGHGGLRVVGGAPGHQPGQLPDHQAETARLRGALTGMSLRMAADDPGYGASLAARLARAGAADGSDTAMLREFLHAAAGHLQRELHARPGVQAAACEYARAWAGTDLAEKLHGQVLPPAGDPAADAALLAVAVAVVQDPAA